MAEYSKLITTLKGRALFAKLLAGREFKFDLPYIAVSSKQYELSELEGLDALEEIRQSSLVARKEVTSTAAMRVETAFTNEALTAGYYMRTVGLFATDPDEGEILFAVAVETSGMCYMPPYNGLTISGAYITLITEVGNAENVVLEVSPAAMATVGNILDLQKQIGAHEQKSVTDENGVHGLRVKNGDMQYEDEEGNFIEPTNTGEDGEEVVTCAVIQLMIDGTYTPGETGGGVSSATIQTMIDGTYKGEETPSTPDEPEKPDDPAPGDDTDKTASDGDIKSIIDNLYK